MLFRWGRWARRAKLGTWPVNDAMAGLDNSVIPWLKRRDIAILGWEVPGYAPRPAGDLPGYPVHDFALTIRHPHPRSRRLRCGRELAAARKRWRFMLTIAPLRIPNGTGSPVNPLAVF